MNALLEVECKGNVILEFLWSSVIMFLFMMKFSFIVINLKHWHDNLLNFREEDDWLNVGYF